MSHKSDLIAQDIDAYLEQHETKELLRFITCGSVDDGKSTLIGRLLHDSQMIYEDQLAAVSADSGRFGTTGDRPDLALLVDGLQSEREQGITIDVAYRYFSTEKRKFIIADTPGHEQYTRNMATGASTADLAVILVDATRGVLTQTKRHSTIASLLGIRHLVIAVNKMDLVDYAEDRFREIEADVRAFLARLEGDHIARFVPISALEGDNVVHLSDATPWYRASGGQPLMDILETVDVASERDFDRLRFPVQYVNRPDPNFRGYSGTVASGTIRVGDDVMVLPSRMRSRVKRIVTRDGDLEAATADQAVTVTLADDVDVGRGDMLVHPGDAPSVGTRFDAHLVWMSEAALEPGRQYFVKMGATSTSGVVQSVHHRLDVSSLDELPSDGLSLNEIGLCRVALTTPVAFDAYDALPATGSFILIDRRSHATVAAGMVKRPVRDPAEDRASNVVWQDTRVDKGHRSALKHQKPVVVWLTGLSGAGKSTIANALEQRRWGTTPIFWTETTSGTA